MMFPLLGHEQSRTQQTTSQAGGNCSQCPYRHLASPCPCSRHRPEFCRPVADRSLYGGWRDDCGAEHFIVVVPAASISRQASASPIDWAIGHAAPVANHQQPWFLPAALKIFCRDFYTRQRTFRRLPAMHRRTRRLSAIAIRIMIIIFRGCQ